MKIHEYQARELFASFGVPVPAAIVVESAQEAADAFRKLKRDHKVKLAVIKAQVHAGGRGKGGGVKLVKTPAEAKRAAEQILSKPLVTPQTGPQGVPVNKLMVAAGVDIAKEYYIGMAIDRTNNRPVLIASSRALRSQMTFMADFHSGIPATHTARAVAAESPIQGAKSIRGGWPRGNGRELWMRWRLRVCESRSILVQNQIILIANPVPIVILGPGRLSGAFCG